MRKFALAAVVAAIGFAAIQSAQASPNGVKVGVLTCHVNSGWGYVLGSSKRMHCDYRPERGSNDLYEGRISKFGVDLGYTSTATIVWNVVAPTSDVRAGALEGDYAGATASATIGAGLGAHVLLGGFHHSIALQPVSVEASTGLNIAAGIGELHLTAVPPQQVIAAAYVVPAPVAAAAPKPALRRVVHHRSVRHRRTCGCTN